MAPDWKSPTQGNGFAQPRGELHIALIAPDGHTSTLWRQKARIYIPKAWKGGRVNLHVIAVPEEGADAALLLTLVDLGLIDSVDAGIIGYPSGVKDETK